MKVYMCKYTGLFKEKGTSGGMVESGVAYGCYSSALLSFMVGVQRCINHQRKDV
jgi:hypothetical protein